MIKHSRLHVANIDFFVEQVLHQQAALQQIHRALQDGSPPGQCGGMHHGHTVGSAPQQGLL
jgi:hypothetical protein